MKNDFRSYRKKRKKRVYLLNTFLPALIISLLTQLMFIYLNMGKIPFPLPITEFIEFIFTLVYFLSLFWVYPKISRLAHSEIFGKFDSWRTNIVESVGVILSTLSLTVITKILPLYVILLIVGFLFDESWEFDYEALRRSIVIHAVIGLLLYYFVEREKVQKRIRREHLRHAQLQKEEFRNELKNLRKQVNPEFLFGSLRSLEPVILQKPEKANEVVRRLSFLYRSFLENKEQLISLEKEIEIAKAYFEILEIKRHEAISVKWNIQEAHLNSQLPPYSLQNLFEATIARENQIPFNISLNSEQDEMVISIESRGKELDMNPENEEFKTLQRNYSYLTDRNPEFFKTGSELVAKLPLLKA